MKDDMDNRIEELLAFYALGAVTDEERALVEEYLGEHPEARAQIEELESAASVLPYSVSPVEPSDRPKKMLMARVAADQHATSSTRNQPSAPRRVRLGNIFQAFSLGMATVAIVWAVFLHTQLAQLRNEVSTLHTAVVAQANSLDQINQAVDRINAKLPQTPPSAVITVSLKGTDLQPQAKGQLIADPNSNSAVLVMTGLAPLEAGKTYQIWLIKGDQPVSVGLLEVEANGECVLILTSEAAIGSFDALGISIEPEGGSPQPRGDIVVLSNLQ